MIDELAAFSWVLVVHAIVKSEQADVRMTDVCKKQKGFRADQGKLRPNQTLCAPVRPGCGQP